MWFLYIYRKPILISIFTLLLIGIGLFLFQNNAGTAFFEAKYDWFNNNPPVYSKIKIDEILDSYPSLTLKALDKEYLKYTKSTTSKYKDMLANGRYYPIPKKDLYKKIVGEFRINHFVCKDKYYKNSSQKEIYWLLDKKLLYKTLELMEALDEKGFNKHGFYIKSGHRHPAHNEKIKGASKSRHIKGQAVDIVIQDINKDGKATQKDKTIVYDLLNKKIIGNQGGIGRYPGTMVVHYDVRGTRARWDSY